MHYKVGEFADLSGVSAKTLRFYDEIGLFRPASVDARTRYRFYLPQQLHELASIVALRDLGVPLARLRRLTQKAGSENERREILLDLKRMMEQSIKTTTQSLNWIVAALDELGKSEHPIPVVVKRRPAVLIASVRSKVQTYAEIERCEQELCSTLPARVMGELRGVLWHHCADSDYLEGEAFVSLTQRVPARTGYDIKQLPPATLACAYSRTDEIDSERAYQAIRRWMKIRGYRLAGPKREIYQHNMLEIQFPLKSQ